jgi:hypothetical protein
MYGALCLLSPLDSPIDIALLLIIKALKLLLGDGRLEVM